jgi:hypothetical protein
MSYIQKFKYENQSYSMISNAAIQDKSLSFKARGLLCYLLSMPDDWKVYTKDLINRTPDGRDSIRAGLKELIEAKYINRVQPRLSSGKMGEFIYYVYQEPTGVGKSGAGLSGAGQPTTTNKTKTKETIDKSIYTFCSDAKTVHEYFFSEYEGFFGKQHRLVKRDTAIELETFMSDYSISQEDMIEKIDEFFKEDYDMDRCTLDYFVKAYCKRL